MENRNKILNYLLNSIEQNLNAIDYLIEDDKVLGDFTDKVQIEIEKLSKRV